MMRPVLAIALCALMPNQAVSDPPQVVAATAKPIGGAWQVTVTLRHGDTGWDHYADGWDIRTDDGTVLGHRVLAHPHVDEQPFTRSLSGVEISEHTTDLFIFAKDNLGHWTPTGFRLRLP